MFRDGEIISKLEGLRLEVEEGRARFLDFSKDFHKLSRKIDDVEALLLTNNGVLDDLMKRIDEIENHTRSDVQHKKILKDAMEEFKQEMEKPVKKPICKVVVKKK